MAFVDLYGAWKINEKTARQKVQSPFFPFFFPNALNITIFKEGPDTSSP
jgi:hypothetical protein